ncbi:NAD-dependent epimerase/dehydratase family protein [Pelagicoccus mobilis]|uniref:NAD(P)-dependent oxidoreductase n=1 Tax=Pelagicoccus mobilis TaxID=415221 RepID=A0A934RYA6_9BACT|nr:NAD(P)-dependent oxidoreductase [Pelagicoccus mobilis]MBK1876567.1 NAD(P)-dependent oxidoreductase [Pelagicoccus mobilis]
MPLIAVTGGSGKAGNAALDELSAHGYDVINIDTVPPRPDAKPYPFKQAELCNMGEVIDLLNGCESVVHMAAIPNENHHAPSRVFENNTMSTYNIFQAAATLKLKRVVWASSETVLGLSFGDTPPLYAPVDDDHAPYPNSRYSLSKSVAEEMARQFSRWSDIPIIGLRFTNIFRPEDYAQVPSYWDDPMQRIWNLWGYVDTRDVGQSCRVALEANVSGAPNYTITAADTIMNRSSKSLMDEVFPNVTLRKELAEFETLLSCDKAKAELGYSPQHSWRNHVSDNTV